MTTTKTIGRPILFSNEMVRAILYGAKTQTRRVVNFVRGFGGISEFSVSDTTGYAWKFRDYRQRWNELRHEELLAACPFGTVSERLRVREKWRCHLGDIDDPLTLNYAADDSVQEIDRDSVQWERCASLLDWKWHPSILMPRWATRIWLDITDVRVERLQSITEADSQREGVQRPILSPTEFCGMPVHPMTGYYRDGFRESWDKINKPGSQWKDNSWVWAITFQSGRWR